MVNIKAVFVPYWMNMTDDFCFLNWKFFLYLMCLIKAS